MRGIRDAMAVRRIRNSCSEYLTGNRDEISVLGQIRWYYFVYRKMADAFNYRIFLFVGRGQKPVGYGALRLESNRLLVTECVDEKLRGQGYGRTILQAMIEIALNESRELVAEIWADNTPSISLHESCGLVHTASNYQDGREIRIYSTFES